MDARLLGDWMAGADRVRFDPDGWYYRVETLGFSLSPDGMEMTWTPPGYPGVVYQRLFGEPAGVAGVWVLELAKPEGLWRDLQTLMPGGVFAGVWTLEGVIDTASYGYWSVRGGELHRREKRGGVMTDGTGAITITVPYGGDHVGSYAFPMPDVLELTLDGQTTVFERV
jgi:hypothetical protein